MDLKFFLSYVIFGVLVLRYTTGDVLYLNHDWCDAGSKLVICRNIDSRNYSSVEYSLGQCGYLDKTVCRLNFEESPYLSIIPANLPLYGGLKISKTQVQNITSTDLSNEYLRYLDISSNKINFVSEGAFDYVGGLVSLNLSGNELQTLPADIFWYNWKLQTVDLSFNKLNIIHPDAFQHSALNTLDLSYNKLSEDLEFLQKLVSLNTLYITGNGVKLIRPRTFAKLINLKELFLADNGIERLDYGSFPLKSLETLDLARNGLHQLHLGIFVTVRQLEKLYLEGSQIDLSAINFLIRMLGRLKEIEIPSNFYSCVDLAEVIIGIEKRSINLKVREADNETPNIDGLACVQHY